MKTLNENGAAVVEFAVVLPLLLLLVFGIIEFGTFLYDKAVITNASREGCRAAIVYRPPGERLTQSDVESIVTNYTSGWLLSYRPSANATNPRVKPLSPSAYDSGDLLTVEVEYDFGFLFVPAFITDIAGTVQITGVTTMRVE